MSRVTLIWPWWLSFADASTFFMLMFTPAMEEVTSARMPRRSST